MVMKNIFRVLFSAIILCVVMFFPACASKPKKYTYTVEYKCLNSDSGDFVKEYFEDEMLEEVTYSSDLYEDVAYQIDYWGHGYPNVGESGEWSHHTYSLGNVKEIAEEIKNNHHTLSMFGEEDQFRTKDCDIRVYYVLFGQPLDLYFVIDGSVAGYDRLGYDSYINRLPEGDSGKIWCSTYKSKNESEWVASDSVICPNSYCPEYAFEGWYYDENYTKKVSLPIHLDEKKTYRFYGKIHEPQEIQFIIDGQMVYRAQSQCEGKITQLPDEENILTICTENLEFTWDKKIDADKYCKGYSFGGWYYDEALTQVVTLPLHLDEGRTYTFYGKKGEPKDYDVSVIYNFNVFDALEVPVLETYVVEPDTQLNVYLRKQIGYLEKDVTEITVNGNNMESSDFEYGSDKEINIEVSIKPEDYSAEVKYIYVSPYISDHSEIVYSEERKIGSEGDLESLVILPDCLNKYTIDYIDIDVDMLKTRGSNECPTLLIEAYVIPKNYDVNVEYLYLKKDNYERRQEKLFIYSETKSMPYGSELNSFFEKFPDCLSTYKVSSGNTSITIIEEKCLL